MNRFLILLTLICSGCGGGRVDIERRLELNAKKLFNSYETVNVRLDQLQDAVVLDSKKIRGEPQGWIETDVIDLFDPENRLIGPGLAQARIEVACRAETPEGTVVELSYSLGDRFFSSEGWSEWKPLQGLARTIESPESRYLKLRIGLGSADPGRSPAVFGLSLGAAYRLAREFSDRRPEIIRYDNPKIVRSPVEFGYERADQPAIKDFLERNGVRGLVSGCRSELDTLVTLLHWVARIPNTRHGRFSGRDYPWDIGEMVEYDAQGRPSIEGHCMSYAVVFISAATGLGFTARHWADQGFRFADHEVVEVWCNSLGRWVYFDPSLDHYYADKASGRPLSILDLHRVFVGTFFKEGETLRMPMDQQRIRVKQVGGKNVPIEYVSGDYSYGKPNPDYDWGWFHGYLACGFLRLTTRNDFHSRKEPWFPHFGQGVHDFDSFLSWSDEKTPVAGGITRFSERERDFYWTLNQAGIKAARAGESTLELELGHSMPFFKEFLVSVDGGGFGRAGELFSWALHQGENAVVVRPVNEWGLTGIPAALVVRVP